MFVDVFILIGYFLRQSVFVAHASGSSIGVKVSKYCAANTSNGGKFHRKMKASTAPLRKATN